MHGTVTTGAHFAGDLIGFSAELLITVLLLALTLRAANLPGTPLANVLFAVCALLWSAGGLAYTALIAAGISPESRWVLVAQAVHFSGAVTFPIPILTVWRAFAVLAWQKTAARILQTSACLSAAAVAIGLWSLIVLGSGQNVPDTLKEFIFYDAAVLLVIGAVISLRRRSTPRTV